MPRIHSPERCFPVLSRNPRKDVEFARALGDGFATLDAAVHALHRLRARSVEILPTNAPQGGAPDAWATANPSYFIEAKRVRGDLGYLRVRDETESALLVAGLDPLTKIDIKPTRVVNVSDPAGWVEQVLVQVSDKNLCELTDRVVRIAERGVARSFRRGAFTIRVNPTRSFGLSVMFGAGVVEPLDIGRIEARLKKSIQKGVKQLAAARRQAHPTPVDLLYVAFEMRGMAHFFPDENRNAIQGLQRKLARVYRIRMRLRSQM